MSGVGSLGIELRSLGLAASTLFLLNYLTDPHVHILSWNCEGLGLEVSATALVQYAQGLGFNLQYCKENNRWNRVGIGDSLWR